MILIAGGTRILYDLVPCISFRGWPQVKLFEFQTRNFITNNRLPPLGSKRPVGSGNGPVYHTPKLLAPFTYSLVVVVMDQTGGLYQCFTFFKLEIDSVLRDQKYN